jgi:hypothetical protein
LNISGERCFSRDWTAELGFWFIGAVYTRLIRKIPLLITKIMQYTKGVGRGAVRGALTPSPDQIKKPGFPRDWKKPGFVSFSARSA